MKKVARSLEAVHTHTLCLLNKENNKKLNKIEVEKVVDKT